MTSICYINLHWSYFEMLLDMIFQLHKYDFSDLFLNPDLYYSGYSWIACIISPDVVTGQPD